MADKTGIETISEKYLCPTYARYPLAVKSALGCSLYDFEGREYLDLLSGISVCGLGHSHPLVVDAIKKQADKLIHVSNLFYQEEQAALAEKLAGTCSLEKVFFCNSGAEANEGAIKLTRRYMRNILKQPRFEIITLSGSFHGRTLATLTATGQDKIRQGFEPLPTGFRIIPFNDPIALEKAVARDTAAVMIEIIQGEGGIKPLSSDFLEKTVKICRDNDLLLIIDEIQTGMGRTGKFWAHHHFGLEPDIITSAKAMANGLPMGAVMCKENISRAFDSGSHGTTFGGNPLACAAALKVLEVMDRENLVDKAGNLGRKALQRFELIREKHPDKIVENRGMGLMLGIELSFPGNRIWKELLEKGYVLNLTQETVLRLLPPLIISLEQLEGFALTLEELLQDPELCRKD